MAELHDDARIWRYMDFPRFVAMLEYGGIFFSPVAAQQDVFEGSLTKAGPQEKEELRRALEAAGVRVPAGDHLLPRLRAWMSVSSWHASEHESAAMWKLYSASQQAIAIVSQLDKLRSLTRDARPAVHVGAVKYISYDSEPLTLDSVYAPFLHKRKSFEYERELRALTFDAQKVATGEKPPDGVWVKLQLNDLIEQLYVAPDAERWYVELVERVSKRYGLRAGVHQSRMADAPIY